MPDGDSAGGALVSQGKQRIGEAMDDLTFRMEKKHQFEKLAQAVFNETCDEEMLSDAEVSIAQLRIGPLPLPYTIEQFLQEYRPGQVLHLRKHQNPEVEYWTVITRIAQDNVMGMTRLGSVSLGGFDKAFTFKDLTRFDIEQNGEWKRWSSK